MRKWPLKLWILKYIHHKSNLGCKQPSSVLKINDYFIYIYMQIYKKSREKQKTTIIEIIKKTCQLRK